MQKTFAEMMEEYDAERIAEINRNDTPEARARTEAKRRAEADKLVRNRRHTIRTERLIPLYLWG